MKNTYYIFSSGRIERKENTIYFIKSETNEKLAIPVNTISALSVFGEIDINKRALEFLTENKIPIHFYNYYEYYVGTYYPREHYNSGLITIKQAEYYLDEEKRLFLAKNFLVGGIRNMVKNLEYYNKRGKELTQYITTIQEKASDLGLAKSIPELMQIEGGIRQLYYQAFNEIIQKEDFYFDKRTKRPPENPINALISFGNSLMYTTVLTAIYQTHLDPRIGYLHSTNQRSFSLNLDIAEVFKPIIVDRVIFSIINRNQITIDHFEEKLNYSYLKEKGRKIFVEEYEKKLNTTITHKKRKISYRELIKTECYKLYKQFIEDEPYSPFLGEW